MASVKVTDLKLTDGNPRTIKDAKFEKLCSSIKDFPKMMELRPIVVDEENMILGGNMRFRAIKELGNKTIPESWIKRATGLTEEQKKEFIIKDNASFGEWDWEILANEWDNKELLSWGVDVWQNPDDSSLDLFEIEEEEEEEEKEPKATDDGYARIEFVLQIENKIDFLKILSDLKDEQSLDTNEQALVALIEFYNSNK